MGLPSAVHFLSFVGKPRCFSWLVHGPLFLPLDSTSVCTLLSYAIYWPCAEADITTANATAIAATARVRLGQEGQRLRLLSRFTKHEAPGCGIWFAAVWHFSVLGAFGRIEPHLYDSYYPTRAIDFPSWLRCYLSHRCSEHGVWAMIECSSRPLPGQRTLSWRLALKS